MIDPKKMENCRKVLKKIDSLLDGEVTESNIELIRRKQLLHNKFEQIIVQSYEECNRKIETLDDQKLLIPPEKRSKIRRKLRKLYFQRESCKQLLQ